MVIKSPSGELPEIVANQLLETIVNIGRVQIPYLAH
jgi:hypothetical protein